MSKATTTRASINGNSLVIKIPQNLRTENNKLYVSEIDDINIDYPANDPWSPARQAIGLFSDDFMFERNQPSIDEIPERALF